MDRFYQLISQKDREPMTIAAMISPMADKTDFGSFAVDCVTDRSNISSDSVWEEEQFYDDVTMSRKEDIYLIPGDTVITIAPSLATVGTLLKKGVTVIEARWNRDCSDGLSVGFCFNPDGTWIDLGGEE